MYDFSKATDTRNYFNDILKKLNGVKVIGVFSPAFYILHHKTFIYMQDEPVYIMLDNGKCLVIDYMDVDRLRVEYREMTEKERDRYDSTTENDCFNRETKIYDYHTNKVVDIQKSSLNYSCLTRVELTPITKPYSTWIDGHIVEDIEPTADTFNDIKFVMDNGKSFCICADDPIVDGYSLLWSEDADETTDPA